jgi:hypothetical protein
MTYSLGAPPPPTSDFDLKGLVGSHIIVAVGGCHPAQATRFGVKPVVRGAVLILDGNEAGKEYHDVLIFNTRVVRQLKGIPGQAILGRVVDDPASLQGAVILEEATGEWKVYAQNWQRANPGKVEEMIKISVEAFAVEERRQQDSPPQPVGAPPARAMPPSNPPPIGPNYGQPTAAVAPPPAGMPGNPTTALGAPTPVASTPPPSSPPPTPLPVGWEDVLSAKPPVSIPEQQPPF